MKKNITIVAVAFIIVLAVGYYYILGLPHYSIYQIGRAFKTHDVAMFNKYVDADSIIDKWVDSINKQLVDDAGHDEFALMGIGIAQLMMPNIRSQIKDYTKRNLESAIEDLSDKPQKDEESLVNIAETDTQPIIGFFKALSELKLDIKQKGKVANVSITTISERFKDFDNATFKMRQTPSRYWQIVEISLPTMQEKIQDNLEVAEKNKCIENSKMIDAAVQIWAIDTNASDSDRPTKADLVPMYLKEWPTCRGNEYEVPAVNESAGCPNNIIGHPGKKTTTDTEGIIEFRLVIDDPEKIKSALSGKVPFGCEPKELNKEYLLLETDVQLSNSDITHSSVETSSYNNMPYISIQFSEEATNKFAKLTKTNIGRRLAILWSGKIMSAPVIREEITNGKAQITGNFSLDEANELAKILNSHTLSEAVAFIDLKGSVYPINKNGLILSIPLTNDTKSTLPIVKGLRIWSDIKSGSTVDDVGIKKALLLLDALKENKLPYEYYVVTIDIANPKNISFYLKNGTEVRIGEEDFSNRLNTLKKVLDNLNLDKDTIKYIDLRFRDVVIGPK